MSDSIAIVTDSTTGVEALDPDGPWTVIPLELEIDGRRYREGPELSAREFHHLLQTVNTPPTTLPPPIDTFIDAYRSLLERNDRVLSIHLSSELSDTVAHARAAADLLDETDRVDVVDSRLVGPAAGLLCLEARAGIEKGTEPGEIVAALERIASSMRIYFSVFTLDYLYLGGRLERRSETGRSSQAEDRPILTIEDGRLVLVERVVGETTRVARTLELTAEEFGTGEPLVTAVAHAGSRGGAAAERLAASIEGGPRPVVRCHRVPIGPVLCAHTGFDVCGLVVYPARLSMG